jgi:hypothetical protein
VSALEEGGFSINSIFNKQYINCSYRTVSQRDFQAHSHPRTIKNSQTQSSAGLGEEEADERKTLDRAPSPPAYSPSPSRLRAQGSSPTPHTLPPRMGETKAREQFTRRGRATPLFLRIVSPTLGRPTHSPSPCWEGCGRHLLPVFSFPAALPTGARV